jgi:hypothetical protein
MKEIDIRKISMCILLLLVSAITLFAKNKKEIAASKVWKVITADGKAAQRKYALIPLPDFTQVDLTTRYTFKKLSVGLKASNVFNVPGFYAHEDGSVNPIAPTQFAVTAACRL